MIFKKVLICMLTFAGLSLGTISVAAESNNYSPSGGEVTIQHWMNIKKVMIARNYNSFEEIPKSIYHGEQVGSYYATGRLHIYMIHRLANGQYRAHYSGTIGGNF